MRRYMVTQDADQNGNQQRFGRESECDGRQESDQGKYHALTRLPPHLRARFRFPPQSKSAKKMEERRNSCFLDSDRPVHRCKRVDIAKL